MAIAGAAPESDEELLAQIGSGSERALSRLYARYSSVVFSFVLARMADRSAAEEVAADVWLGCWRSARGFRQDSRVLTWLLGIAKRQIYVHTRRKRLAQESIDDREHAIPADDEDPADLVAAADEIARLLAALDALPEGLRETVRLSWVHDLPYREDARIVGIPQGTVKSRVSRARRLLREEVRDHHA